MSGSAFAAALLPLTMRESKELTPAWMNRLAMAKMAFWNPAGRPSARMLLVMAGSSFASLKWRGVAVLHPGQGVEDEPGRNTLGNGTGQRHAHDA